jgi:hypothetical protein
MGKTAVLVRTYQAAIRRTRKGHASCIPQATAHIIAGGGIAESVAGGRRRFAGVRNRILVPVTLRMSDAHILVGKEVALIGIREIRARTGVVVPCAILIQVAGSARVVSKASRSYALAHIPHPHAIRVVNGAASDIGKIRALRRDGQDVACVYVGVPVTRAGDLIVTGSLIVYRGAIRSGVILALMDVRVPHTIFRRIRDAGGRIGSSTAYALRREVANVCVPRASVIRDAVVGIRMDNRAVAYESEACSGHCVPAAVVSICRAGAIHLRTNSFAIYVTAGRHTSHFAIVKFAGEINRALLRACTTAAERFQRTVSRT